ncbi:helix-turn-helix domain-containing protein [Thiorhodococcus drewsii]|nr:helix-turn-helix domain-containing protein [Thiorhodococcus drewsii]
MVQRSQMVLRAADGETNKHIASTLGVNEDGVGQWRRRWLDAHDRLAAATDQPKRLRAVIEAVLADRPRSGAPGDFTPEQICQIIALACETPPPPLTHWTRKDLVRETIQRGIAPTISATTIGRILKSGRPQAASDPLLAQSQDS